MSTEANIKFCPVCKQGNHATALVCIYCGASLEKHPTDPMTTRQVQEQSDVPAEIRDLFAEDLDVPAQGLALFIPGHMVPVAVRTENEFVLGRAVKDTANTEPLVDLTAFDGYAMGVSRRHALIRSTDSGYALIDLQSSNGTWLDARRVVPDRPYPLPSGTAVYLGRLKLLVLYRSRSGT